MNVKRLVFSGYYQFKHPRTSNVFTVQPNRLSKGKSVYGAVGRLSYCREKTALMMWEAYRQAHKNNALNSSGTQLPSVGVI